jgi:hypothetical protein
VQASGQRPVPPLAMAEGTPSLFFLLTSPSLPSKVEWDLLDDLFGEVNPWEILLASKPTPGPSSGGPRPPNPPP